ncbi:major histocompatibility complex class I-related protein [Labeo rohita]|uniref:Major histocompatibility complex class I-related protein n=1 Tax=Labeo rohita TaxID=84645 RepID=A0A498MI51_LABRO|nr:major histocompatibility complex class I-related protein [Labeo rohita]
MIFMFFVFIPLVNSVSHTFMTIYSGLNGQAVAGTTELLAETTLDDQQIDYYDSDTGTLIPKQDWMREFASRDKWKKYTEIRERVQQTNKLNITLVMQQFSHSDEYAALCVISCIIICMLIALYWKYRNKSETSNNKSRTEPSGKQPTAARIHPQDKNAA